MKKLLFLLHTASPAHCECPPSLHCYLDDLCGARPVPVRKSKEAVMGRGDAQDRAFPDRRSLRSLQKRVVRPRPPGPRGLFKGTPHTAPSERSQSPPQRRVGTRSAWWAPAGPSHNKKGNCTERQAWAWPSGSPPVAAQSCGHLPAPPTGLTLKAAGVQCTEVPCALGAGGRRSVWGELQNPS